jgi:hypothetical protein
VRAARQHYDSSETTLSQLGACRERAITASASFGTGGLSDAETGDVRPRRGTHLSLAPMTIAQAAQNRPFRVTVCATSGQRGATPHHPHARRRLYAARRRRTGLPTSGEERAGNGPICRRGCIAFLEFRRGAPTRWWSRGHRTICSKLIEWTAPAPGIEMCHSGRRFAPQMRGAVVFLLHAPPPCLSSMLGLVLVLAVGHRRPELLDPLLDRHRLV